VPDPLAGLLDRQAVHDLTIDLFCAVDERDWPAARACFAPSVHFDMTSAGEPGAVQFTPEEITGAWETGLRRIEQVHHQAGNFRIAVDGDEADATCHGIALHHVAGAPGGSTRTFVGTYRFHLLRDGERWCVDRFRFGLRFIDGNLELGSA
jgi:hypothetical protein